jgi:hypothetical protein
MKNSFFSEINFKKRRFFTQEQVATCPHPVGTTHVEIPSERRVETRCSDVLKRRSDALKRRSDVLKRRSDVLKRRSDALKRRSDALKIGSSRRDRTGRDLSLHRYCRLDMWMRVIIQ